MNEAAHFRSYVELAPFGIFITDHTGRYLEVNPAAVALTGYSEAELLTMHIPDLLAPESLETALEGFASLVVHGSVTAEYEFHRKDGTRCWFSLHAVRVNPQRFMGFCQDITQRKQAEVALHRSEERFAQITAQSRELIWEVDSRGLFTYVSPACLALLGYAPGELVGKLHFYDLHPEAGRAAFRAAAFQVFAPRLAFTDLEHPMVCQDGRVLEVLTNGVPFFDPQGAFCGYRGSDKDITALKRAEADLQRERLQAEAALRRLSHEQQVILDTVALGIGYSKHRKTQWANPAHDAMLGYAHGATVGLETATFYARRADYERIGREGYAQLALGNAYSTEVEMKRQDGSVFWCGLAGRAVDPSHLEEGAIWIFSDTTERRRAESLLRKLSGAVEHSPASIVITDHEGRLEYVNPKFCEGTGYSFEEVRGQNPRLLKSGQNPPELYQQLWDTITQGREWRGEFCNRRKNGEIFWEFASISPIRDAEGHITHFVAVKEDITERKRAEAELLQTNRNLEAATARANQMALQAELASIAKSDFIANMSHELRTPMNGVLGLLGLVLDTDLTEEQRQFIQTARSSGQALLVLLNDLLDYSKIEARKLKLETLDFSLARLLDDLAGLLAPRAREKGLVLGCVAAPEAPSALRGDPGRLRQILLNLTGNALKFTSRGEVAVRVSVLAEAPAEVHLRFSVRDTGPGIPADKLGLLFKKFSQLDSSTTRLHGGTGLGLAISKQLAELMGGEIGVESQLGQGSEFWFTVRLAKATAQSNLEAVICGASTPAPRAVGPSAALSGRDLSQVRLLVAEDNLINQQVAVGVLKKLGFTAEVVADGLEAVQALERVPYDLVFMDVQMPEMDGFEATRVIRDPQSRVLNHQVPIIAMTAHAMQGDRARCLEAGMDDYVPKPVEVPALTAALNQWLKSSGQPPPSHPVESPAPAVSPQPAEVPVFDRAGFLARLTNDDEFARVLIQAFLEDMPQQMKRLRDHLAAGDTLRLEQMAHKIKGASATMGGEAFRAAAAALEDACKAGDLAHLPAQMAELNTQFETLRSALKQEL